MKSRLLTYRRSGGRMGDGPLIAVRPEPTRALSNTACIRWRSRGHNGKTFMFARLLILFYAIVSYAVFFVSTLYAIGFVGNFRVPKSIDTGGPADLGEAIGVDLLLLGIFCNPAQHYGAPAFQKMVGHDLSAGLPAQHLRAALQPDPAAAVLAMAADPDSRLAGRRRRGLADDRRLLAGLGDHICLELHDQSFRTVRPAPGDLCATRGGGARPILQDAAALQGRAASHHAGLFARILGHARDDRWPFVVRHREHGLHPGRGAFRGTRFGRRVRCGLSAVSRARSHAVAAHLRPRRSGGVVMRAVLCSAFTGPEDLQIGEIEEPKPASDE